MAEDLKLYIAGEWTDGTGDAVHGSLEEFTDPQTVVIDLGNVR